MSPVTRRALRTFLGSVLLLAAAAPVALADDDRPDAEFVPSNDEIDRELDQSLEEEFADRPNSMADGPQDPDDRPDAHDHDDDDRGQIRLRLMGAYWRAQLHDIVISHREGLNGGDKIEIDDLDDLDGDDDDDDHDLDGVGGGHYELTLDMGRHVALRGGFSHAIFKNDTILSSQDAPTPFSYGDTTFSAGNRLETRFELYVGDLDLVLRPINNRYITIDVSIGARYMFWETELTRGTASKPQEKDRLESVIPMVGLGLALRPVPQLELFGRVRYGHLSYEVDEHYDWDEWEDEWDHVKRKEREATSMEVDLGLNIVIADTVGLVLGYRFDFMEMDRETDQRDNHMEGTSHGLYAGLILQFSD